MKNWIVVANASRARILQAAATGRGLEHVADLVHPESRMHGHELARDRPGHVEGIGHGLGSAAYQPRETPRRHEHRAFARELAARLTQGVRDGDCAALVLVASNPFLGELKAALDPRLHAMLLRSEPADWTALDEREIVRRLGME
jgi:protein required for attachment to host cells